MFVAFTTQLLRRAIEDIAEVFSKNMLCCMWLSCSCMFGILQATKGNQRQNPWFAKWEWVKKEFVSFKRQSADVGVLGQLPQQGASVFPMIRGSSESGKTKIRRPTNMKRRGGLLLDLDLDRHAGQA